MSGIKVLYLPSTCTEKDIKIHFTKPTNGGGQIEAIYFPIFHGHAIVLFENELTAETVLSHKHTIKDEDVDVEHLPISVFEQIEAKLTPAVAAFLEAVEEVRDEMEFHYKIELVRENGSISRVRGNWYLLEWFWSRICHFMQKQAHLEEISACGRYTEAMPVDMNYPGQHVMRANAFSMSPFSGMNVEETVPEHSKPVRQDTRKTQNTQSEMLTFQNHSKVSSKGSREQWREPKSPVELSEAAHKAGTSTDENSCESDVSDTTEPARVRAGLDRSNPVLGLTDLSLSDRKIMITNDNPEDSRTLDFTCGPLSVSVYTGMITMIETDAIVNAANGSLVHGAGVAWAIASAAGSELQEQCDEYIRRHGCVQTTEVMHTCAGGKISNHVKYVMHAVGPIWIESSDKRTTTELTLTFLNCMKYANERLKIRSIAMPLISSGVFGCPLEVAVGCFFTAVLLFISDHAEGSLTLQEVHLINNNSDNTFSAVLLLRSLIEQDKWTILEEARIDIARLSEGRRHLRLETNLQTSLMRDRYTRSDGMGQYGLDDSYRADQYHQSDILGNRVRDLVSTTSRPVQNIASPVTGKTMVGEPRGLFTQDMLSPGSAKSYKDARSPRSPTTDAGDVLMSGNTSTSRSPGPPTAGLQSLSPNLGLGGSVSMKRTGQNAFTVPKTAGRPLPPAPTGPKQ